MAKLQFAFVLVVLACCAFASVESSKTQRRFRPIGVADTKEDYVPGLPGGFKCAILPASTSIPTDARRVRFADIKVIGALGDSLTAANGVLALTLPGVGKQYRGLSWSVGGDNEISTVLTLSNILKKYNPQLYGYSLGSSWTENTPDARYNVASVGDTAVQMDAQSRRLVEKILKDNRQSQWKLITLFIGGNDVCRQCEEPEALSAENYKKNILSALQNIYDNFPNTIVNLVTPIDLKNLTLVPDRLGCKAVHRTVCGCVYNPEDPDYATRVSHEYQDKIKEIIAEAPTRFPRQNFAISYQPQFASGEIPLVNGEADLSYFAPDCFHFSQKGHEHSAITLWNNMLRPLNQRSESLQMNDRSIICPTESSPYIQI